jgi:hypothetical protein
MDPELRMRLGDAAFPAGSREAYGWKTVVHLLEEDSDRKN